MEILGNKFGELQINDAKLIFRNFGGVGSKYNREGDRNFSILIPNEETANALSEDGWNVKITHPQRDDVDPVYHLPVKLKFNHERPELSPKFYLYSGKNKAKLTEDSIYLLDSMAIASVDLNIRPYDWDWNGKQGRTAYLKAIKVTKELDRFEEEFAEEESPSEEEF